MGQHVVQELLVADEGRHDLVGGGEFLEGEETMTRRQKNTARAAMRGSSS